MALSKDVRFSLRQFPSSLTAIGLAELGVLSVLLGAVLFIGVALAPAPAGPQRRTRPEVTRRLPRHGQTSVIAADARWRLAQRPSDYPIKRRGAEHRAVHGGSGQVRQAVRDTGQGPAHD